MVDSNPFLPFISFFVLSPIACSQRSVDESFETMMREEFVSHLMRRCIPAMMFAEGESASITRHLYKYQSTSTSTSITSASITRHHVLPLQGRLALHAVEEVAPSLVLKDILLGFLSLLETISYWTGGHVVKEGHEELEVCNA